MQIETPVYERIVLKLSGEAMQERGGRDNISLTVVRDIAERIKEVRDLDVQVAVVIGGGNIWRGLSASYRGMDRTTADYMGMLATVINALALRSTLDHIGVETRVQTAIDMRNVAEPFILGRAVRHLELGRVVIFAAGTGNPYFSTDTTAALRATEIRADVILKATTVDGVYDRDPNKYPDAKSFDRPCGKCRRSCLRLDHEAQAARFDHDARTPFACCSTVRCRDGARHRESPQRIEDRHYTCG